MSFLPFLCATLAASPTPVVIDTTSLADTAVVTVSLGVGQEPPQGLGLSCSQRQRCTFDLKSGRYWVTTTSHNGLFGIFDVDGPTIRVVFGALTLGKEQPRTVSFDVSKLKKVRIMTSTLHSAGITASLRLYDQQLVASLPSDDPTLFLPPGSYDLRFGALPFASFAVPDSGTVRCVGGPLAQNGDTLTIDRSQLAEIVFPLPNLATAAGAGCQVTAQFIGEKNVVFQLPGCRGTVWLSTGAYTVEDDSGRAMTTILVPAGRPPVFGARN